MHGDLAVEAVIACAGLVVDEHREQPAKQPGRYESPEFLAGVRIDRVQVALVGRQEHGVVRRGRRATVGHDDGLAMQRIAHRPPGFGAVTVMVLIHDIAATGPVDDRVALVGRRAEQCRGDRRVVPNHGVLASGVVQVVAGEIRQQQSPVRVRQATGCATQLDAVAVGHV